MKFQQARNEVIRFHKENKAVAAVVWFAAMLLTFLFMLRKPVDIFPTVMLVLMIGFSVTAMLARYRAALDERITANKTLPWTVKVNEIEVGEISDADYARIRRGVFFDSRLYVAQLINVIGCAYRAINSMIWALPVLAFWGAAGCYFFAPESFAEALHTLQAVTREEVVASIPAVFNILVMTIFLYLFLSMAIGKVYGFVNRFDEAVAIEVRKFIKCPSEGSITLSRWVNGNLEMPREAEYIRAKKG